MIKQRTFLMGVAMVLGLWGSALAAPAPADATDPVPADPLKVQLSRQNARLHAQSTLSVVRNDGQNVVYLPLPANTQDLTLELAAPHTTSLRSWRMENTDAPEPQGTLGKERAQLQSRRDEAFGQVQSLKARLNLWTGPLPAATSPQEAENMRRKEEFLRQIIPTLGAELAQAERTLHTLDQRLAALPAASLQGKRAVLSLDAALPAGTAVTVNHAYTLDNASWQPAYTINALPTQNQVRLTLLAEIRQYSGLDWREATVELSDAATTGREPAPLPAWLVRKGSALMPRAMARNAEVAPVMLMAAPGTPGADAAMKAQPRPQLRNDAALAGWTLPKGQIVPEGMTTLPLVEETWDSPLQRVARPGNGDRRVWLQARHELGDKSLPAGEAAFLVDGVSVGTGPFVPDNGQVSLFFGADPLVSVKSEADTRKSGKSGVVNKRQTWNWGWTYTVFNQRDKAVTVRIEDAATQAGDEAITVTYADKPAAKQGEDKTLTWELNVPAKGKAEIQRAVTVTAPQDMQIQPGR